MTFVRLMLKASCRFLCMFPTPEDTLWYVKSAAFLFYLETRTASAKSEPLQRPESTSVVFVVILAREYLVFWSNQMRLQRCFKLKVRPPPLCRCVFWLQASPSVTICIFLYKIETNRKKNKLVSGLICFVREALRIHNETEYFMKVSDKQHSGYSLVSCRMPFFKTVPQKTDFHCHSKIFAVGVFPETIQMLLEMRETSNTPGSHPSALRGFFFWQCC